MILCCGEALIDFVPLPEVGGYKPCPGGSVYNIAVGLGRLGTPAGFFCKISTDFFGDQLLDYLNDNGVDTNFCPRSADPTTLAFVSLPDPGPPEHVDGSTGSPTPEPVEGSMNPELVEGEGEEPRFMFYANDTADRLLTADELPPLPEAVNVLHFGSISLVMEPGATALETLMHRESGRRIISLDPNVRPGLIADPEAYREHFEGWVSLVDIVKLSRADFVFLYPDRDLEEVIADWFIKGISLCIVTLGAEGSAGYTAAGVTAFAPAPRVKVADTVGAGDTFLAATLSYLAQKGILDQREQLRTLISADLAACLAYAGRAAAINCSRQGANPPYKHEMKR